ncbi:tetratricopeptide repeat protein [Thiomicrorhabdus aquaedulcis]|uniref:tetratricopeptide repeat protein n=1 Tax=Thiomicrorhabdus aquaedulcis TaxID=2211106 RepID=UPI000FD7CFFA|nr:tetratricopeptide repeat protein [Thiomicrorhabdus aquaedulcis]
MLLLGYKQGYTPKYTKSLKSVSIPRKISVKPLARFKGVGALALTFTLATSLTAITSLTGCSNLASQEKSAIEVTPAKMPEPVFSKPLQPTAPAAQMSAQTMFKVMAAEMLVQKGALSQAYQIMFELAQENQDAQLAQRAFQLSLQTFNAQSIEQSTQLWRELAPQEALVWRASFLIALRYENLPLAIEQWQRYHSLSTDGLAQDLIGSAQRVAASTPAKTGLAFFANLATEYPSEWSAYYALGTVASAYNEVAHAIGSLEKARELISLSLAQQPKEFTVVDDKEANDKTAEANDVEPKELTGAEATEFNQSSQVKELKEANDSVNQLLAKLYLQLPSAQTGLDALATAVHDNPHDWLLQERYARLEVKAERFESAEKRYQSILETNPDAVTSRLSLALLYMERKAYKEAELHLQIVSQTDSYQMVGAYYLGVLYQAQKQFDAALAAFKQVDTSNYYVDAQLHIAEIYFAQQGVEKALTVLEQIVADAPQDQIKVLRAKAIFHTYVKKYREAIDFYQAVLAIEPNHVDVLLAQAVLFYNDKKFNEYEANLSQVIALRPNNVEALNALGYFYAEQNIKLDEAEGLLSQALKLAPDNYYVLDSMGWLYYQQKITPMRFCFYKKP